ncbi:MAG: exodeoxyribonuclease VII large subunit [Thiolinea sp.]
MSTHRIVLSVSQLNAEVNQLLSDGFPALWVEGEISNLSRPRSGHLYFTLKDAQAQLRCAMFRNRSLSSRLQLENGMQVLARGQVGLYEARGDYQFIISVLEEAGEGRLQREFEQLKQRLSEEGLFAAKHKQPLPGFPQHIGVITSPSGAAIRDILNVLQRRCPQIPVSVFPVAVQGTAAAAEIVQALQQANRDTRPCPAMC